MAKLDELCKAVHDDIDGSLAFGIVDLSTGMFLAVHHSVPYFSQGYIDAIAAASIDMFRGKNIQRVEKLIDKMRGEETNNRYVSEIFMTSMNTYHFMKVFEKKDAVAILVTKKTTNQGMGWAGLKGVMGDLESALP